MQCPKCHAVLREVQMCSGASGLMRNSVQPTAGVFSGLSCWRCGVWLEAVVMPVAVVPPVPEQKAHAHEARTAVYSIVTRFYDSILAQRKQGASWDTIASLLRKIGEKVNHKSLQKYFVMEHERRCCNGNKTKKTSTALHSV